MDTATALMWLAMLLVLGVLLICVEMVIPGGVVGTVGVVVIFGSIVWAFVQLGFAFGAVYASIALVLCGVALYLMVRVLSETKLGGRIVLQRDLDESKSYDDERNSLVGLTGVAVTDLRPAGTAKIDGKRVDVVTEGGFVEKDSPVSVVEVEGSRIVVRGVEAAPESPTQNA